MNRPSGTASAQHRILRILIGTCCALIFLFALIGYLDREGIVMFRRGTTHYYSPADLANRNLPQWHGTNGIPLAPDQAVLAAMRYANDRHPSVRSWDVDSISLRRENESAWAYSIYLIDRQSGRFEQEHIKVLMDGSIWKPRLEKDEQ